MNAKNVKQVFIQNKTFAINVIQLWGIALHVMHLNVLIVEKEKNYKMIDVWKNVVKIIILTDKNVRNVVKNLKNVNNVPSMIVMNVKKIITC